MERDGCKDGEDSEGWTIVDFYYFGVDVLASEPCLKAWRIYLCVSCGGKQGSDFHEEGQIVFLSDFWKTKKVG